VNFFKRKGKKEGNVINDLVRKVDEAFIPY